MTPLEGALLEVTSALDSLSLPHMLVGGLAVSMWGAARSTIDVDITAWVGEDRLAETVEKLCSRLRPLIENPTAFVNKVRVLPLISSQNVRVDLIFAALPFELAMIKRAKEQQVAGRTVRVASPEDLVVMKLVSEREKDHEDARMLIACHGESLEIAYIESLLDELAKALERPDLVAVFRRLLAG